jgi:hypothetical protein
MNHFIPPLNTYVLRDTTGASFLFGTDDATVAGAHSFMRLVTTTDSKPFKFDKRGRLYDSPLLEPLGRLGAYANLYTPDFLFEPLLNLFFQVYAEHRISQYEQLLPLEILPGGMRVLDVYTDFIETLRKVASEDGVRHRQANWESKYKGNLARLLKLEASCFEKCSRVAVVLMHFYLKKWLLEPQEIDAHHARIGAPSSTDARYNRQHIPQAPCGAVAFEEMQAARGRFFVNAKGRPSIFRSLLGRAWRIDFAPQAGYHLHALFLLDGYRAADHVLWGERVGQFWNEVNHYQGRYCNGNIGQSGYDPRSGIGLIDSGNFFRREFLRDKLLRPMAQLERAVVPPPFAGANLFGTSKVPRRKPVQPANQGTTENSVISKILIPQSNQQVTESRRKNAFGGGGGGLMTSGGVK